MRTVKASAFVRAFLARNFQFAPLKIQYSQLFAINQLKLGSKSALSEKSHWLLLVVVGYPKIL